MKKYILLAFFGLFIFNSCQFNQSVNKDLTTGAYSRGDGITCDDVVLQIKGKNETQIREELAKKGWKSRQSQDEVIEALVAIQDLMEINRME